MKVFMLTVLFYWLAKLRVAELEMMRCCGCSCCLQDALSKSEDGFCSGKGKLRFEELDGVMFVFKREKLRRAA